MSTRGRDFSVKERRGRSPLLPRKVETGQQTRSLINPPSSLEKKHALTNTESKKIPIYDKHTVSSTLYALNTIRQPSVENAKFVPQSKVMYLKSKFNEKKATNSYTNTTSLTKTKDVRKPDIVKEFVHGKKQVRQPTRLLNAKDDQRIVTHDDDAKTTPIVNNDIVTLEHCDNQCVDRDIVTLEHCDNQCVDREDDDHGILTCEVDHGEDPPCETLVPTCSQDNSTVDQCISTENTDNKINRQDPPDKTPDGPNDVDQCISTENTDNKTNRQDPPDKIPDGPNDQHPCIETDQQVVVEQERSMDVESQEEPKQTEVKEVPKEEDRTPNEVVAQRKKETAACEYVIEEVIKEQRLNRVKALVGTFEILISLQCDALQNRCLHT